ncbi:MAG: DUF2808 domain-containing protein [Mastigocoleus sp. MO_167.B18]|nr:DUF2808 domain-containing protein [Mastigocoleus sp. MO_167.B18]
MKRFLSALLVTGCLLGALPTVTLAQSGLTLFSGVKSENELRYRLDFGGQTDDWDRYRLRIPQRKMKVAAAKFVVSYPKYYEGTFDTDEIEIKVKRKKVKVSEVKWDKEANVLEIYPEKPVPAGNRVELILSNVRNPSSGGIFYFNCSIQSPGDVPLARYIGTWIIDIS